MRRALGFAVAALALSARGCAPPAQPFDPMVDCAKLDVCGQCASRGACAWCGDTNDGGKGQCVAVGHAECAAPKAWTQTPEQCPPPPAGVNDVVTSAAPAASAGPASAAKLATIHDALTRAFPAAHVDATVTRDVAEVLTIRRERGPITRHVEANDHRLYLANATHHRVKGMPPAARPMESEFTMTLPMVRVSLPEKLEVDRRIVDTEIGDVDLSRDHLLGSVDLIAAKYGDAKHLGYRPARVDLVTPARGLGTRFGAIAVYLGYRGKSDRGPSFYLLEAGTATGDAKMIYFSPDMKEIPSATSYYLPTPFVTMRNTYSGGITMRSAPSEDEPRQLVVRSLAPGATDPYITVTVNYVAAKEFDLPVPVEITVDAGARVALIAKTMGLPNAEDLEGVLADLGKTLPWMEMPRYTAPAAPATAGSATPAAPLPPAPLPR